MYLTRSLKEHTLLQAIARVNRLAEGKDYGLIIDYYGNLEHFIFGGKLATGKSLPFAFKDGEDIAIVYVTFVTEDNKDEQNIKKMGQDFEAQFFKMPIQN